MAEFFSAMASGLAALLELIFYCLVFLARQSITLIGYICSRTYRERKNVEWGNQHLRKKLALGFSGACLIGLIAFCAWTVLIFGSGKKHASEARQDQKEMRLELHAKDKEGKALNVTINDGGISNILTARSLKDFKTKVKENLIVVGETNQVSSYSIKFQAGEQTTR